MPRLTSAAIALLSMLLILTRILSILVCRPIQRPSKNLIAGDSVGADVQRAVSCAADAARDPCKGETGQEYFVWVLSALQQEHARYQKLENDKGAYGHTTFREIIRNFRGISRR